VLLKIIYNFYYSELFILSIDLISYNLFTILLNPISSPYEYVYFYKYIHINILILLKMILILMSHELVNEHIIF
jgi:hypothetical protein